MKFEINKDYKGRDGRKLTVLGFAPEADKTDYPMAVYDHKTNFIYPYTIEGKYQKSGGQPERNIVGEWKELRTCTATLYVYEHHDGTLYFSEDEPLNDDAIAKTTHTWTDGEDD